MLKVSLIGLGVLVLDQLTKYGASLFFPIHLNTGVSFGLFEKLPAMGLTLLLVSILGLLFLAFKSTWLQHPYVTVIFFSSAFSNVIDRLLFGGVRDWLRIPFTTIYNNIADYLIFFAIIWLLYVSKVEKIHE